MGPRAKKSLGRVLTSAPVAVRWSGPGAGCRHWGRSKAGNRRTERRFYARGYIGVLKARGRWRSGGKGTGLCEWVTLEVMGGGVKRRQCLGGRKQELEVGKAIPKKKALWECGRSVEEE